MLPQLYSRANYLHRFYNRECQACGPGFLSVEECMASQHIIGNAQRLRFWTNVSIGNSIAIGFLVILAHGGVRTAAIAAYGAAIGLGGILGFLFGVPGTARSTSIDHVENLAVGGQNAKVIAGGNATPQAASPNPKPEANPAVVAVLVAGQPAAPAVADLKAGANPTPVGATEIQEPETAHHSTPGPSAASNLEQVADWVTKLLLGGGLTQMQRIPPKIWQWARAVAIGIEGVDPKATPLAAEQSLQAQQAFAAGLLTYGFVLGFFAGFLITRLQFGRTVAR
jgi:hypothetical protein